jgi:hypothetical protein
VVKVGTVRTTGLAVVLATALVLAVVLAVLTWGGRDDGPGRSAEPSVSESVSVSPSTPPEPAKQVAGGVTLTERPYCLTHKPRPITPVRIAVEHVTRGSPVLALSRDQFGTPGVPPETSSGKLSFGWDAPGLRPGVRHGNAIMTAHTWPDGSAMGNFLLAKLHEGDRVTVFGPGKQRLCYRVFDRVQIAFTASGYRFYDKVGPHDLVFIVCSGTRLGPGLWTHRTILYSRLIRQRS